MKKDSLLYFSCPQDFEKFYCGLDVYAGWKIRKGIMNDRGKCIRDKSYTIILRNEFKKKAFFRKLVSLAEVVTWLDNMLIISRVLRELKDKVSHSEFSKIEISMEYVIRMSKRMRIDFVFKYKNNLLILEMRTVSSYDKIRSEWTRKFRELLIYKELISNYCKSNVIVYALISMYEYDRKELVLKNRDYNTNQVNHLSRYIIEYLLSET